MGKARPVWQEFKKKYPAFEKSKSFKSDVGPQMDQFEEACAECLKLVQKLETQLAATAKTGASLKGAMAGYMAVFKDLQKQDPNLGNKHLEMFTPCGVHLNNAA